MPEPVEKLSALFAAKFANSYQRALDVPTDDPNHRINVRLRERAWQSWSIAQSYGLVLQ